MEKVVMKDVHKQLLAFTLLTMMWRAVLFLVGAGADRWLRYAPSFPYADDLLPRTETFRWLYSWANFDGVHYLTIAQHGYIGTGLVQAFFPFFPFVLLRPVWLLTESFAAVFQWGMLLTNVLVIFTAWMLWRLTKFEFSPQVARMTVVAFYLFPTSFFLGAFYTESIFLAAVFASFWFARHRKWGWATVTIGIAMMSRVVGVFLLPAIAWEVWESWRASAIKRSSTLSRRVTPSQEWSLFRKFLKVRWQTLMLLSVASAGLLTYMIFLWHEFGDPLYFFHVQSEFGGGRSESLVLYPQVWWRSLRIILTVNPLDWHYFSYALEFLAGNLGLLGLIFAWKRGIRHSYLLFAAGCFFLPTLTGTFSSLPRYILVCFPLYWVLAFLCQEKPRLGIVCLVISTVALMIATSLFIQGYWVA